MDNVQSNLGTGRGRDPRWRHDGGRSCDRIRTREWVDSGLAWVGWESLRDASRERKWETFSPTWERDGGEIPAGVTVASDPALIDEPNNGLVAVWRGSDGNLYETVAVSGKWETFSPTWERDGGEIPAGVTVASDPAIVYEPSNGLVAVWRGSDGNLYETVAVKGKWETFSPTWERDGGEIPAGVTAQGDPAIADEPSNGLVDVWRGSDGNLYETVAVKGKWETFSPTWERDGGEIPAGVTAQGDPAIIYEPANGLVDDWRGSDGNLYETVAVKGKWETFSPTWERDGGEIPAGVTAQGDPAIIYEPANGLVDDWRGSDGNLYETVAPGGKAWETFSPTWGDGVLLGTN